MGVGKVRNWKVLQVSLEGNHDNPVSGTHSNQSTGAWRKYGDREQGSHKLPRNKN